MTLTTAKGGETVVNTTEHHPFWSEDRHDWIYAADLRVGEQLKALDGSMVTVKSVKSFVGARVMHDLTVDTFHTYYVMAATAPVLVHNCGGNTMSSAIGKDPFLTKAAQQAGRNERVQQEFGQLKEGNMNPGLGTKSLSGTDVSYARGRNGARLFFRNVDGGIQIVGKADKGNESAVIRRLINIYGQ